MNLYDHQVSGIRFLLAHPSAGLFWEMGTGKTRTAILAAMRAKGAQQLLVLCPAAVRFAWGEELGKLMGEGIPFTFISYRPDERRFVQMARVNQGDARAAMRAPIPAVAGIPVCILSYGLLSSVQHTEAIVDWVDRGNTILVCDESSFLKNRSAARTRNAMKIAVRCTHRWLLTGTPIANSPEDLWAQGEVMSPVRQQGPLAGLSNYYHFIAKFAQKGGYKGKQIVEWPHLDQLTERFKPYVSRVEKKDCLDLPEKSYVVREVALTNATWDMYQELRRDAILALGEDDIHVEPHAAVRVMRLCQITSGHIGLGSQVEDMMETRIDDLSCEKLKWLTEEIESGELSRGNIVVWCRWRRERERLFEFLHAPDIHYKLSVFEIYGGQSERERDSHLKEFMNCRQRAVILGQPHAGGFGLDFTNAHQVVYLSNDFSYSIRNQSEDRCHRIGQKNLVTYMDVLATGPNGEHTVDHKILAALRKKEDVAKWTCAQWKEALL